jgi:hypothetical protein
MEQISFELRCTKNCGYWNTYTNTSRGSLLNSDNSLLLTALQRSQQLATGTYPGKI